MPEEAWDSIDFGDLAKLRNKQLRRQVRFQLYAFSRYYKTLFDEVGLEAEGFAGTEDLEKIPLVYRQTLGERPDDFVLQPSAALIQRYGSSEQIRKAFFDRLLRGLEFSDKETKHEYRAVHYLETQGTTGDSLNVQLSRRDLGALATESRRMLEVAGCEPDDTLLNLLEPSPVGGYWATWMGAVALGMKHVAPGPIDPGRAHSLLKQLKAQVMIATAEEALNVLEHGAPSSLKTVIIAPEPLSALLRRRLKEAAGEAVVVSTYGFAEGRALWAECRQGAGELEAGYHISGDLQIIELISRRTLKRVKPHEPGEIVFTGLDQRGTALARYLPGDVAMGGIRSGACPYCSRRVERLVGPIRRAANLLEIQLAGDDPLAVDAESIRELLAHPRVSRWEVEVAKADGESMGPDEVFVFIQPRGGVNESKLMYDLDRSFLQELGFSPTQFVLSEKGDGVVVDGRPAPQPVETVSA